MFETQCGSSQVKIHLRNAHINTVRLDTERTEEKIKCW